MTEMLNPRGLKKELIGKRIKLLHMKDDTNPVPDGMEGTVQHVDDMGTIHVKWDNGRTLGVIVGIDRYLIL